MQRLWKFDSIRKNSIQIYHHFKGEVKKKSNENSQAQNALTKMLTQTQWCVSFLTTEMKLLGLTASGNKEGTASDPSLFAVKRSELP